MFSWKRCRWVGLIGLLALCWSCSNNSLQTPCTEDADCQRGKIGGVCLKKFCAFDNSCEQSCKEDKECSNCGKASDGFGFRCRNGTCLPVSQGNAIMDKHEQCGEAIGKDCLKGFSCEKPSEAANYGFCYPQCDSTKNDCDDGKGRCIAYLKGDVCLPKGTGEQNDSCGLSVQDKRVDIGKICKPNLACTRLNATNPRGFCFATCNPAKPTCENKGVCTKLSDGTGVCIPKPTGKEGNPCDTLDKIQSYDTNKICPPELACSQGKCIKRERKNKYEKCNETTTCGEKALCIVLQRGHQSGYCVPLCQTAGSPCENGEGTCRRLSNGQGVCLPGQAKENEPCGLTGEPEKINPSNLCKGGLRCNKGKCAKLPEYGIDEVCSADRLCKAPLVCIAFKQPGTVGICLPTVLQCSASACGEGRICLPGPSGSRSVCVRACSDTQGCPNPLECSKRKVNNVDVAYCITP